MIIFVACAICIIAPVTANDIDVNTIINKSERGEWQVTYRSSQPVDKLVFVRSPDSSRIHRWASINEQLAIVSKEGTESIISKDKSKFSQATFVLTPTYINLPKDYAPFSPFSDGSMLLYSGRFFVCANQCNEHHTQFPISVVTSKEEKIIANGQLSFGKASWIGKNSGQKVYVGSLSILESDDLYAVIDPGLPESLKLALQGQLPTMMAFFTQQLGPLKNKPMLFASYEEHHIKGNGHQGGTLPNQIFMHWYGEKSLKNIRDGEIQWFIAHEVAHLYQGEAAGVEGNEHAWIHEGAAEYMAYLAMSQQSVEDSNYATKTLNHHIKSCVKDTKRQPISEYLEQGYFHILYHCGSLVWQRIESDLQRIYPNKDAFEVWKLFQQKTIASDATLDSFINTVEPIVSKKTMFFMQNMSDNTGSDFEALLDQ